jgi:hypothetical protein
MRRFAFTLCITCLASISLPRAHADRVHLVGGTSIEGKVTRGEDKVVITLESGALTLPAEAVERIESSESNVEKVEQRRARLRARDIKGRLELAEQCHEQQMSTCERELLREVIGLDPNNEQARTRLGYVKTDAGWVPYSDAMRAQGMVEYEGRWLDPRAALELERMRAETETAKRDSETARTKLEVEKTQLAMQQNELESARNAKATRQPTAAAEATDREAVVSASPSYFFAAAYPSAPGYGDPLCGRSPRGCGPRARAVRKYPFEIPGVRHPSDPTFISGVRDPLRRP